MTELEANGCLDKVRTEALEARIPTTNDAAAQKILANYKDVLVEKKRTKSEFSRDISTKGILLTVTSIDAKHFYKSRDSTADLTYLISLDSPSEDAESSATLIELKIELRVRTASQLQLILEQSYRVDGRDGCGKTLTATRLTKFTPKTKTRTHMDAIERNILTGQVISHIEKEIDSELLRSEAEDDVETLTDQLKENNTLNLRSFVSADITDATMKITRRKTFKKLDPILGRFVDFDSAEVAVKSDDFVLSMFVESSTGSEYSLKKTEMSGLENSLSENISQKMWMNTPLNSEDSYESAPTLIDFSSSDLSDPKLTYALGLKNFKFDNYAAYFDVSDLDKTQAPENAPADYTWKKITHKKRRKIPELRQIFKANTDANNPYLKSTFYLDHENPLIATLAKKTLELAEPEPTYGKVIQNILIMTNHLLKYDHESLRADSINLMRASDALNAGKGVCQHFAAVFTSLARSMGLPARVISGYLFTPRADGDEKLPLRAGPHAWVEVLVDGKIWLPLEPQFTGKLYLPGPNYLPLDIMRSYETKVNEVRNIGNILEMLQAIKNPYIKRLPHP